MTVIRFKIGDVFPADDPVARFITGIAMVSNEWLRLITDMVDGEPESSEAIGRQVSLFRRQAALVHEAAIFIGDAVRMFPAVAAFVAGLDELARDCRAQVVGANDPASRHYLGAWLEQHRNVTHHYPRMHPEAERHGNEELANALRSASDLAGSIDSGGRFGDARFGFADEVGVQLLPTAGDAAWVEGLRDTGVALAKFAQDAAQAYLETQPGDAFTSDG